MNDPIFKRTHNPLTNRPMSSPKRDWSIFRLRNKGVSFDEIGEKYMLTRERVRQLYKRAKKIYEWYLMAEIVKGFSREERIKIANGLWRLENCPGERCL